MSKRRAQEPGLEHGVDDVAQTIRRSDLMPETCQRPPPGSRVAGHRCHFRSLGRSARVTAMPKLALSLAILAAVACNRPSLARAAPAAPAPAATVDAKPDDAKFSDAK